MKADILGTRQNPGCMRFDLLQETDSNNNFITYETYAD